MNCRHAHRLFGAYWDDEITQAEREWLEGHFTACDSCRTEYEDYSRALEALATLPRIEPQPNFAERALARARRTRAEPDRVVRPAAAWVPLAAAAALIAVAGTLALPWLSANRSGPPVATATRSEQPRLAGEPVSAPEGGATAPRAGALVSAPTAQSSLEDSLLDRSGEVEFILDPVTLRRGRASLNRPATGGAGDQAVVSF